MTHAEQAALPVEQQPEVIANLSRIITDDPSSMDEVNATLAQLPKELEVYQLGRLFDGVFRHAYQQAPKRTDKARYAQSGALAALEVVAFKAWNNGDNTTVQNTCDFLNSRNHEAFWTLADSIMTATVVLDQEDPSQRNVAAPQNSEYTLQTS